MGSLLLSVAPGENGFCLCCAQAATTIGSKSPPREIVVQRTGLGHGWLMWATVLAIDPSAGHGFTVFSSA